MEFAGQVLRAGPGADRFAPGDRVMSICGGGGQAEMVVVPESSLLPVPDGIDDAAAGGFPEAFSTAQDALFTQAGLCAGERVRDLGGGRWRRDRRGAAGPGRRGRGGGDRAGPVASTSRSRALGAGRVILPEEVARSRTLRRLPRAGRCTRASPRCCRRSPSAPASWSSGWGQAPGSSSTCWR